MIESRLPGTGKTTAAKHCGYKLLFVTPYNKLSQELRKDGHRSVTLHKLLGMTLTDDPQPWNRPLDVTPYEAICFDEIMLYNAKHMARIYKYILNHPDHRFFATGDADQLMPFDQMPNNVKNVTAYMKACVEQVFPNVIILKENKRLKTIEDKQRLNALKADIFDTNQKIKDVLVKHGIIKTSVRHVRSCSNYDDETGERVEYDITVYDCPRTLYDVTAQKNITYFNYKAKQVNTLIHNNKTHVQIEEKDDFITIKKIKY